jgi:hypothetical protein
VSREHYSEFVGLEQGMGCLVFSLALLAGATSWWLIIKGIEILVRCFA